MESASAPEEVAQLKARIEVLKAFIGAVEKCRGRDCGNGMCHDDIANGRPEPSSPRMKIHGGTCPWDNDPRANGGEEPRAQLTDETLPEIVDPIIKRAMKRRWRLDVESEDGASFRKVVNSARTYYAIVSAIRELDGKVWVHLSLSLIVKLPISRTPSVVLPQWSSLTVGRDEFLGHEAKCILVVAPAWEHVNFEEVPHIWHCPEGDGLPDFTRGSGSI